VIGRVGASVSGAAALALVAVLGVASPAQSEASQASWPQKPVRIVTPFAAGGNTDGNARIIAHHLGEAFGQQFIVDHRPGASGAIAAETVARSPADGYTLFLAALPQLTIVPALVKTSYDPVKDFIPISNVGTNPFVLVVHPGMPVTTLPEFIDHARRQNGKLAYAASGAGSLSHIAMALFVKRAAIEMVAVTYKGGAAPLTDVLAGHVPTYLTSVSGVLPHAMRGALRPIAISGRQRAAQMPDVPTFIEAGFTGFNFVTWNGLLAPAGTPREIVERIAQEVARAAKDPKVAARLAANGVDPLGDSPQEFAATIAADIAFWTEAVRISGVQEK
jgi:tripartite-type tricarboxylate transporter receptor subunit TctC